ncbi:MAG: DUF3352 domain-containing protein [Anaerolineae bacterium]|nr:DUF3352 domain-containing protein [Anaerolineae bacterium]
MKKWLLLLMCLALSLAGVPSVAARGDFLDVMSVAALFPPAEFFVALRADQAFAERLDALSVAITAEFAAERVRLSQLVDALFGQGIYSLSRLVNARFVAFSINGVEYLVDAELVNDQRAELRAVIGHGLGRLGRTILPALQSLTGLRCQAEMQQTVCQFEQASIFKTLSIDEQHIVLLSQPTMPLYPLETLATQPEFTAALSALPESMYDGFAFVDTPHLAAGIRYEGIREMLAALGFPPSQLAAAALGLRLQSEGLQLDVVQRRLMSPNISEASLDLNFARFIPETAAIYLQTRDLSRLTEIVAGLLGSLSATLSSQEAYTSLRQLFRSLFRLDLESDLLSWAQQSDYAVFIDAPSSSEGLLFDQLEIGFILSGTDPQRMATVAESIADGLERQLRNQAGFTFQRLTSPALSAPVRQLSYRDPQFGTLALLIGSTDQFVFFSTARALTYILEGRTFEKRLDMARLSRYLLPLPNVLIHADADNATRFLSALLETLSRLNGTPMNNLPALQADARRFERAVLSVDEGTEAQVRLRLFLLIGN